jgi:hypothetical protein
MEKGDDRRRKILSSIGLVVAGGLTGCSGNTSDTPTQHSETDSATETGTSTPTSTEPTESPTESETPGELEYVDLSPDVFSESPSSDLSPTDGYADVEWLEDESLEIVKVTNLKNSGHGSLRWALKKNTARLIVFEVGGVIDLEGDRLNLFEDSGDVVVAGQTAPDPGITLIKDGSYIGASNVVIQHLRFRPGTDIVSDNETPGGEGYSIDAMNVGGTTVGNVIIDHCAFSWGSDELLSSSGRDSSSSNPFTFSNCIIAEGLRNTELHPEDNHSYGSLFSGGHDTSVYGNLYANNQYRNPFIGSWTSINAEVVNNLIFNCGGGVSIDLRGKNRVSVNGNKTTTMEPVALNDRPQDENPDTVYLDDNMGPEGQLSVEGEDVSDVTFTSSSPLEKESIEAISAENLESHVVDAVGPRPAVRTHHDERIISQLVNRSGQIIDSQSDVGGYPDLTATHRELDIPRDQDNVDDWFESHTRKVEISKR